MFDCPFVTRHIFRLFFPRSHGLSHTPRTAFFGGREREVPPTIFFLGKHLLYPESRSKYTHRGMIFLSGAFLTLEAKFLS